MDGREWMKLEEASVNCDVPREFIVHYIEESWILPQDKSDEIMLDEEDRARIRLIWELVQYLGVNEEAVPIILNLVDQVNRMHIELERFRRELS